MKKTYRIPNNGAQTSTKIFSNIFIFRTADCLHLRKKRALLWISKKAPSPHPAITTQLKKKSRPLNINYHIFHILLEIEVLSRKIGCRITMCQQTEDRVDNKRKQQSSSNKILLYVKSHKICTLRFHTWHITFEFTGKLERNLQYGILRRRCLSCLWICKDRRDNQ